MGSNTKVILGLLAAAVVIWLGVAVFKQGSPEVGQGPIKIGYIGPLTGEAASLGEPGLGGAQLAVKEINDAGGVLGRSLELVAEDDKCSNAGVEAMTKLVNVDRVVAVTGPDCSASGGPALPIAQQAGVPVVVRWASAPHLTKIGDYIFRVYPSDAFQGGYAAEFIKNELRVSKVAVLYVKNDWGQGIRDVFVEKFRSLGGEVVYDEGVTQESRDVRTQLTKVKSSGADALYAPLYPATAVPGLKQAKELGLNIPILGGDAFEADEFIQSPGAEGVMYTVAVLNNAPEFQQRVTDATGKKADKLSAAMAYDGVKIIAAAIERAGSTDGAKVKAELVKTSYVGVSSPLIEFDANGDVKGFTFEVKVVRGGRSVSR